MLRHTLPLNGEYTFGYSQQIWKGNSSAMFEWKRYAPRLLRAERRGSRRRRVCLQGVAEAQRVTDACDHEAYYFNERL
jgi:hypothetical protein